MNIGKLNTRIQIKKLTNVSDNFGAWTNSVTDYIDIWAKYKQVKGLRTTTDGQRQTRTEVELICRADTIDFIDTNIGGQEWFFQIDGVNEDYRINDIYESEYKNYTKIQKSTAYQIFKINLANFFIVNGYKIPTPNNT